MTTNDWFHWALLSAVFAALTAIFAKLGLLADTIVAGAAQAFSMRPKPACIGMPPGTSRTQPSRTCGAQEAPPFPPSRAQATRETTASNSDKARRYAFMRL